MIDISENPAITNKICADCKFFFKRYVIKNENYYVPSNYGCSRFYSKTLITGKVSMHEVSCEDARKDGCLCGYYAECFEPKEDSADAK